MRAATLICSSFFCPKMTVLICWNMGSHCQVQECRLCAFLSPSWLSQEKKSERTWKNPVVIFTYLFDNHCHKVFVCLMKLAKCSMVKSNYGNFCSRENHAHRVGPSQNCLLANSCQCIKYASLTLLIFLSGRFVSLKPEIRTYLFAKWHSTMKRPNKVCCESSQKNNVIRL